VAVTMDTRLPFPALGGQVLAMGVDIAHRLHVQVGVLGDLGNGGIGQFLGFAEAVVQQSGKVVLFTSFSQRRDGLATTSPPAGSMRSAPSGSSAGRAMGSKGAHLLGLGKAQEERQDSR